MILQKHIGKQVTVKLDNGGEMTGTVKMIGNQLVHMESLEGRDFFDAVISINRIEAIIARVKGGAVTEAQKP